MRSSEKIPFAAPRIAWFSPVHDVVGAPSSLSAYVTEVLVPLLRGTHEITVYHTGTRPVPWLADLGVGSAHFGCALQHHQQRPFDLFFYQVEDQPEVGFSRLHLGVQPGVVLFHSITFLNRPPDAVAHSPYQEMVGVVRGERQSLPTERVWHDQGDPFGHRELALAPVQLFSDPQALRVAARTERGNLVPNPYRAHLPVPCELEVVDVSATGTALQIGLCATPGLEGRVRKVLRSLALTDEQVHLTWLVDTRERSEASALVEEFGVGAKVTLEVGRTPRRWSELLGRFHAAAHLHHGYYGHPSPYLEISLSQGVPVFVSNPGRGAFLPPEMVICIEPGEYEAQQLLIAYQRLKPTRYRFSSGREYQAAAVANELSHVFRAAPQYLQSCAGGWSHLIAGARQEVLRGAGEIFGPDGAGSE